MKKFFIALIILLLTCCLAGCNRQTTYVVLDTPRRSGTELVNLALLDSYDSVYVFAESPTKIPDKSLETLPSKPNGYNPFHIDLRSQDLSQLKMKDYDNVWYSIFDNQTIWPNDLPETFDPEEVMALGMNPGLGIRDLHKQGITGQGVGVAILDSALYYDHEDYKKNIRLYESIHSLDETSQMHGSLVTSLLVGDSLGVAPQADVYYIAMTPGDILKSGPKLNYHYLADCLERVFEINQTLTEEKKIRVVSISIGISPDKEGYDRLIQVIDRAKADGIFVVTVMPEVYYSFHIGGLSRPALADPDDHEVYGIGSLLKGVLDKNIDYDLYLLAPMDNRTSANCTGKSDYQYFNTGGNSVLPPWIAGLYALCLQVDDELSPEAFIDLAYKVAYDVELENSMGQKVKMNIFNPTEMISELKRNKQEESK